MSRKIKTAKWQLSVNSVCGVKQAAQMIGCSCQRGALFPSCLMAKRGNVYLCAEHSRGKCEHTTGDPRKQFQGKETRN